MSKRGRTQLVTRLAKRGRVAGLTAPQPTSEKFSTVRVKLSTVLTEAGKACSWQQYVRDANQVTTEAWLLANQYVATRLEQDESVPRLDQTFFYQCCSFVTDRGCRSTKYEGLPEVAAAHRAARPQSYKPVAGEFFTAYCQQASQQMAQNTLVIIRDRAELCYVSSGA